MQQLTYVSPQNLEWWEVNKPRIENGKEAIVRPLAVARCDLDRYIALGQYRTPGPFAVGHEIAGVVEDNGDKVTGFIPGDRVIVPFQISCGECRLCKRGWTNACEAVAFCAAYGLGTNPARDFGGGLSDAIKVPFADAMLVPIPADLSMEIACGLSDNVADGYRTVAKHLQVFPGEPVLVVGGLAKSVGLYAVQSALACGAERVVYIDNDTGQCVKARKLGAEATQVDFNSEQRHDEQFLITVDASALESGTHYAIQSTAACGFCTSVSGGLRPSTSLLLSNAYLKGIHYEVSRVHARTTLPEVLHKVCCGDLHPLDIAEPVMKFDDAIAGMFDSATKIVFSRG